MALGSSFVTFGCAFDGSRRDPRCIARVHDRARRLTVMNRAYVEHRQRTGIIVRPGIAGPPIVL
jgi:hypothetical protein